VCSESARPSFDAAAESDPTLRLRQLEGRVESMRSQQGQLRADAIVSLEQRAQEMQRLEDSNERLAQVCPARSTFLDGSSDTAFPSLAGEPHAASTAGVRVVYGRASGA
jgi:TolA-binding protein